MADSEDLDAGDLNALRKAMEGLQGSAWQPPAQTTDFTPQWRTSAVRPAGRTSARRTR